MMKAYQLNTHNRNFGCRLTEFVLRDYRAVSLENEKIRVTILLDKGTDICEFLYKPRDVDFLYRSYVGLRSMRNFEPMIPMSGGAFLDYYEGGWQEMFPWGGHASTYRGVETGLHGEVALSPWNYRVDLDTPEEISITCSIRTRRVPFFLQKTIRTYRHQPVLHISEEVQNESDQDVEIVWGHHPAFGWPFLDDSCVVDVPPCKVTVMAAWEDGRLAGPQEASWPWIKNRDGGETDLSKIPGPASRSEDLAFLHGFDQGWYALRNRSMGLGFGMVWDPKRFPYLWFWQLYRGNPVYPWWGMEYVAAIEPVSSMATKFSDAITNGTALRVPAHATIKSELWAWAFEGTSPVKKIDDRGVHFTCP
jgi:hypothetical protein